MPKVKLDSRSRHTLHNNIYPWSEGLPFVENTRGTLIHRLRSGETYNLHKYPHIGVGFWCGMAVTTHGKNLTFHEASPEGKILCEKCESAAVDNGLPSADELSGRHVHIGRTRAVITCCEVTEEE